MKYTLQYASNFFFDLHKRRDFNKMLVPSSENLALLGNICRTSTNDEIKIYKDFLDYCSSNYKNIYIVPGPWELSSKNILVYDECMYNLFNLKKSYKNVTVLNNSHASIPNTDISLVGTTLWSRFPYIKHQCMFEYQYIWLKRHSGLSQVLGHDIINWHLEDIQFMKDMTRSSNKVIMLSHHLPVYSFIHNDGRKRMEATDLEKYIKKPIEIWLGGSGDHSVCGTLGISRDVFCSTNPYTTFNLAKNEINKSYNPEAYMSLRTDTIELV